MAWTTPKTWVAGNTLTAAELNEQVRDNLEFLFSKPSDLYDADEAANWTTSSTTFVDVDATDMKLDITTGGGDILITLTSTCELNSTVSVYFDIDIDGARTAGDDGIMATQPRALGVPTNTSFSYIVAGLTAGAHIIKLQWKVSAGTATMYAGAGTASKDLHPQFTVREL